MKCAAEPLPLFARAKRGELEKLVLRRHEDGLWKRCPEVFGPDELPDREAVRMRFGGGRYEVIGRDRQRIRARTRFVLDGPALPLGNGPAPTHAQDGPRAFATPAGERQALLFQLFEQGRTLPEIVQSTGIDAEVVRAAYPQWLTPCGVELPTAPEQIAELEYRRACERRTANELEWHQPWESP
jgi:hypothetical protein